MDEQEPEKQFEATDYDEKGNIPQTPPPPMAAKKKRITVAELSKLVDELCETLGTDVYDWLRRLDTRLDRIELELKPQSEQGAKFVWDRIDNQDDAIGALADAIKNISEGVATWGVRMEECEDRITKLQRSRTAPQETMPKPELEFAQPPQQTAGVSASKGDIEAVASVCQTMTDVLLICRLLKAEQDIPDEDRTYLLTIACRAAGVPLSAGLQIRAGAESGGV